MDDKFYELQDIAIDIFELDSPIEIEKGVLLLDKTSKNVLLQLKLNVLGIETSRVSSVSVDTVCMDDASEIIAGISPYTFTYRDIFLNKSKTFGDDNPIVLDPRVRRVQVGIHRVVFTDSTTWSPTGKGFISPKQELIISLKPELIEQFQRDIRTLLPAVKERYRFIPKQLKDCWLCTCGRPNVSNADSCLRCCLSKENVFNASRETLQKNSMNIESKSSLKEKYLSQKKNRVNSGH